MARVGAFVFRTGARAGALGQLCTAVVWSSLSRPPANDALIFWRREALVATVISLLWLLCPGKDGRRQPALLLAANAFGCAFAMLMPTPVS